MSIQSTTSKILSTYNDDGKHGVMDYLSTTYPYIKLTQEGKSNLMLTLFGGIGDEVHASEWVHYWEACSYNEGYYMGQYFDLSAYASLQELEEARSDWLRAIEIVSQALDTESYYGDEWLDGDIDALDCDSIEDWYAIQDAVNNGLDREICAAALALQIPLEHAHDAYAGHYESEEDLGYEYFDMCGEALPDSLKNYFDYKAYGRDIASEMLEFNNHYFHGSW